jgi:hypothetical protein
MVIPETSVLILMPGLVQHVGNNVMSHFFPGFPASLDA